MKSPTSLSFHSIKGCIGYFLLVCHLLAADRETIFVDLDSEYPLENIYISSIHSSQNETYLRELREVLAFDFNHNGRTVVASPPPLLEPLTNLKDGEQGPYKELFKKENISYAISLSCDESTLKCQIFNLKQGTGKSFEAIALTKDLNRDRQAIHRLSDAIYKAFFQEEGVASTRFIYTSRVKTKKGDFSYELLEADYDGFNPTTLLHQNPAITTPCYFPATPGKRPGTCLFVSYAQGEPKLYLTTTTPTTPTTPTTTPTITAPSTNEFQPKRLSLLKGNQLTPCISRDKRHIAFISDAKGNPDLYLIDLDERGVTSNPRRIYGFPKAAQSSPTFSPDGKTIAFVTNKDGFPRIYTLPIPHPQEKIRLLKPELLTTLSKESTAPNWSPDGKKLAYSAKDSQGVRQIFVYDFSTKREKQLTFSPFHKENPVWGQNSLHILFNTSDDEDHSIYLMNLHQKGAYRINQGAGDNRFPSWG